MPVAQYPDVAPPQVTVVAVYTGANAEAVETAVTTPLEQAINGVEGMLYMTSSSSNSGLSQITVVFDVTRNGDIALVDVQNRVEPGARTPARRSAPAGRHRAEAGEQLRHGRRRVPGARRVRLAVHLELHRRLREGRAEARARRRRRAWCSASASTRCACGSIPCGWRRAASPPATSSNALREQNVQVAAGSIGDAPAREGQTYQISVRAAGRLREAHEFDNIIVKRGARRHARPAEGRGRRGARRRDLLLDPAVHGVRRRRLRRARAAERERARRRARPSIAELERLKPGFPPGLQYRVAFNTTDVDAGVDSRGREDAVRSGRCWSCW